MNKTDQQLKDDVEAELSWDPRINTSQIGVTVDEGAVSLLGTVDNYPAKWAAEEAAKRVQGVRTVAQDLRVKFSGEHGHSDQEIAVAIASGLKWNVLIPSTIAARVQHGEVTLSGRVTWNFERHAAERLARHIKGVTLVHDLIMIEPKASAAKADVKGEIQAALRRQATEDAKSIHIDTNGTTVTLSGTASSWQSIADARDAAWAAPGVTEVVDRVVHQTTTP